MKTIKIILIIFSFHLFSVCSYGISENDFIRQGDSESFILDFTREIAEENQKKAAEYLTHLSGLSENSLKLELANYTVDKAAAYCVLLANAAGFENNIKKAEDYLNLGLSYLDGNNARELKAEVYFMLAWIHAQRSQSNQAIEYLKKAKDSISKTGRKDLYAYIISTLAEEHGQYGNNKESFSLYKEALEIYEDLGDKSSVAKTQIALAYYGNRTINAPYDELLEYLIKAKVFFEDKGDIGRVAQIEKVSGNIYMAREWFDLAEKNYRASLEKYEAIENAHEMGNVYANLGMLFNDRGQNRDSIDYNEKAIRYFAKANSVCGIGMAKLDIGSVYFRVDKLELADMYLKEAKVFLEECQDVPRLARTEEMLGYVKFRQDSHESARQYFVAAKKHYDEIGLAAESNNVAVMIKQIVDMQKSGLCDCALKKGEK